MKRIGYIYEKIVSFDNCKTAIYNASHGKRDRKEVKEILDNIDFYANDLSKRLEELNFLTPYKKVKRKRHPVIISDVPYIRCAIFFIGHFLFLSYIIPKNF